jgi:hypothetical protein
LQAAASAALVAPFGRNAQAGAVSASGVANVMFDSMGAQVQMQSELHRL